MLFFVLFLNVRNLLLLIKHQLNPADNFKSALNSAPRPPPQKNLSYLGLGIKTLTSDPLESSTA